MKDKKNVHEYYSNQGWKPSSEGGNILLDEAINVNNNDSCSIYNTKTRNRVLEQLNKLSGKKNKLLDVASGAVHLPEYIEYSRAFQQRHCVDFSSNALDQAKMNLTSSGQNDSFFYNLDFLESSFESNYFDAAISLHTLYHVDIVKQHDFVEKLIKYVRSDGVVIIVYSNPLSIQQIITYPMFLWQKSKLLVKYILIQLSLYNDDGNKFYFKRKSIFWWSRFSDYGELTISAERTFSASFEKRFIPNNDIGKKFYNFLFWLESFAFWKYFSTYYIVTIKKR
jgi:ubiquinone/menaquinone biosynthesis C-methylase UbiE